MKTWMMAAAIGAATQAVPAAAQVMAPADYVMAAGAGDLYEITSSKIVTSIIARGITAGSRPITAR